MLPKPKTKARPASVRDEDHPDEAIFDDFGRPWTEEIEHEIFCRALPPRTLPDSDKDAPFARIAYRRIRERFPPPNFQPIAIHVEDGRTVLQTTQVAAPLHSYNRLYAYRAVMDTAFGDTAIGLSTLWVEKSADTKCSTATDDDPCDCIPFPPNFVTPTYNIKPFSVCKLPREVREQIWKANLENFFVDFPERRECLFYDRSLADPTGRWQDLGFYDQDTSTGDGLRDELIPDLEVAFGGYKENLRLEAYEVRIKMSVITMQARCDQRHLEELDVGQDAAHWGVPLDLRFPKADRLSKTLLDSARVLKIIVPTAELSGSGTMPRPMGTFRILATILRDLNEFKNLKHLIIEFNSFCPAHYWKLSPFDDVSDIGPNVAPYLAHLVDSFRLTKISLIDTIKHRDHAIPLEEYFSSWGDMICRGLQAQPNVNAMIVDYRRSSLLVEYNPPEAWTSWLVNHPELARLFPQQIVHEWKAAAGSWLSWERGLSDGTSEYSLEDWESAWIGDRVVELGNYTIDDYWGDNWNEENTSE